MYCYSCFLCIVYNCCIVYRIFLLSCISVTGHFHYMFFHYEAFPLRGFPLRGISTAWFFRYMTFLLCGVYATWHFPCTVYPWYFCVFRPFTFESDFSIFSIHCVFQYSRYIVQELHVCSIVLHFLAAFEGVMSVFLFLLFHIFYGFLTLFLPHPCFSKAKRQRH